jgi:hypothetical protein
MRTFGLDHYSVRHACNSPEDFTKVLESREIKFAILPLSSEKSTHKWRSSEFTNNLRSKNIDVFFALRTPLIGDHSDDDLIRIVEQSPEAPLVVFVAENRGSLKKVGGVNSAIQIASRRLGVISDIRNIYLENHKDLYANEVLELITSIPTTRKVHLAFDIGNQIPLLESPLETAKQAGQHIGMVHLKDIALRKREGCIEWKSVPLGQGIVPIRKILNLLESYAPKARYAFEVSTTGPWKEIEPEKISRQSITTPEYYNPQIDNILTRGTASAPNLGKQELRHLDDALSCILKISQEGIHPWRPYLS